MSVQQATGFTMCLVKAGLAAGSGSSFTTVGNTVFCIDGIAYSVGAKTNEPTPTIDASTGKAFKAIDPGKGSLFLFGYGSQNTTVKVVQGTIAGVDEAYEYKGSALDFCPFAELIVKVAANGAAWTFGSSAQSGATGVTYQRNDLITVRSCAHNV